MIELATLPEADMILIAIVGIDGLRPALAAIEAGKDIAVASKEILVMAGEAVMTAAREKGVNVLPVDSEHNAIFQCLEGKKSGDVSRLILTASGGPLSAKLPLKELAAVTLEQALKHPTWEMGPQDHDRFRDAFQQRPRNDRSPLALRRRNGSRRRHRSPSEHRSQHGGIY